MDTNSYNEIVSKLVKASDAILTGKVKKDDDDYINAVTDTIWGLAYMGNDTLRIIALCVNIKLTADLSDEDIDKFLSIQNGLVKQFAKKCRG